MGVQIEISKAQREAFFATNTRNERKNSKTQEFFEYISAIRSAFPLR
jgi:phage replication-related protein YjqB (UPF0714/DUF867 family)